MMKKINIELYDKTAEAYAGARVQQVAEGFKFTEGPYWHPEGYLLFSDTPANRIYRLAPEGDSQVYLEKSGWNGEGEEHLSDMTGSNAIAADDKGRLLICQHGNHAIAVHDGSGTEMLTGSYGGRPYNSPNDIAVRSDGTVYFSDPPYGLKDQVLQPARFQPLAGLYRLRQGQVTLEGKELQYPNGLAFSPDEQYLYLSSNHPDEPRLWKYTLAADGTIVARKILAEINGDGMTVDDQGNILLATDEGICVISPEGKKIGLLPLPESPSNITWGKDRRTLYITARAFIFRVSL